VSVGDENSMISDEMSSYVNSAVSDDRKVIPQMKLFSNKNNLNPIAENEEW
jgi:hypothetical protein